MVQMKNHTKHLESVNKWLKEQENGQRVVTDAVVAVIAMMSSFGPAAALSALSNNLHHTLASGNRVLDILAEKPAISDVTDGSENCEGDIRCEHVCYRYDDAEDEKREVLSDFSARFGKNRLRIISKWQKKRQRGRKLRKPQKRHLFTILS